MNLLGPPRWTRFDTISALVAGILALLVAVSGLGIAWALLGLLLVAVASIMWRR